MTDLRRGDGPINVDDELSAREVNRIEGERGAFDGGGRRSRQPGAKAFMFAMCGIAAIFVVFFVWKALAVKKAAAPASQAEKVEVKNINPNFQPAAASDPNAGAPMPEAPQDGSVPALDGSPPLTPDGAQTAQAGERTGPPPKSPAQLLRERRLSAGLGGASGSGGASALLASADGTATPDAGGGGGELAGQLQPLRLKPSVAGQTTNRDYLLTRGAMLDCVLETKIVTSVAGMTSCYLTRDIYSASGRVVLLDRGSKVVGFYQGGMRQGQNRIFVQWSRVETPKGVIINVDSPGTGPLGEGGLGGKVDNHFWQRFGGAIMLSLIDDLGDYVANKGNSGNGNLRFNNSSDAAQTLAEKTLDNTINIPPTLYKNQGDRVSVYVARDLDFRGVYGLARK